MPKVEVGARFGKLVVEADLGEVERAKRDGSGTWKQRLWRAACDCGMRIEVLHSNFVRMLSCGCKRKSEAFRREVGRRSLRHGHTAGGRLSPEYMVWQGMCARCTNPGSGSYANYGGRGITVCDRWLRSFEDFVADMGPRPSGTQLDRVDNAKGYEPGNCRWATLEEQNSNRRDNRFIEIDGVSKTITAWARIAGFTPQCLSARLKKGLTGAALLQPSRRTRVEGAE